MHGRLLQTFLRLYGPSPIWQEGRVSCVVFATLVLLAGCHSASYDFSYALGPAGTGPDVLLTYNPQPDYWPTWTGDSTGILYAFVQLGNPTDVDHRCIGVMPAAGGQRYWEWCDDAAQRRDSISSFPAFAMAANGALIYLESSVATNYQYGTPDIRLWLADSATPFRRRLLDTFPVTIGDSTVNWLGDLTWTGPSTFLALGERMVLWPACACSSEDSVFYGEWIVHGSIDANGATLSPVAGTVGASGYSLAENGASIIFTLRDSHQLMRVPVAGGTPTAAATVTSSTTGQLIGVSCRGFQCVVAFGPLSLAGFGEHLPAGTGPYQLRTVSLTTPGDTAIILERGTVLSTPIWSPSGAIVATVGAMGGYLQTSSSPVVDLHLFTGMEQDRR